MTRPTRSAANLAQVLCIATLTGGTFCTQSARAYSDRERFDAQPSAGGGGGRYFTGSPIDGYQCSVCHRGGPTPVVRVRGLPVDGYVPGETYDVEVAWTQPDTYHALQLEMVDRNGQAAGDLTLYDEDALDNRERCGSLEGEERASYTIEHAGRRVLGVRNCDASALRFQFTAPSDEDVAFAGGVVLSDNSATVDGDGFASLNVVLKRADIAHKNAGGSCSVQWTPYRGAWSSLTALSAVLATWVRKRRRP